MVLKAMKSKEELYRDLSTGYACNFLVLTCQVKFQGIVTITKTYCSHLARRIPADMAQRDKTQTQSLTLKYIYELLKQQHDRKASSY